MRIKKEIELDITSDDVSNYLKKLYPYSKIHYFLSLLLQTCNIDELQEIEELLRKTLEKMNK